MATSTLYLMCGFREAFDLPMKLLIPALMYLKLCLLIKTNQSASPLLAAYFVVLTMHLTLFHEGYCFHSCDIF